MPTASQVRTWFAESLASRGHEVTNEAGHLVVEGFDHHPRARLEVSALSATKVRVAVTNLLVNTTAPRVTVLATLPLLAIRFPSLRVFIAEAKAEPAAEAVLKCTPNQPTQEDVELVVSDLSKMLRRMHRMIGTSNAQSRSTGDRPGGKASLDSFGRDLVAAARHTTIEPMYVRTELVRRAITMLDGTSGSLVLVGEPGTGKNAIVQAVASAVARKDEVIKATRLANGVIQQCHPSDWVEGCVYVGSFEQRIKEVVDSAVERKAILFIDDIDQAATAGSSSSSPDRSLARLLDPFVARGEVRLIGATTPAGWRLLRTQAPQFANRFHVLEVPSTSRDETYAIVQDCVRTIVPATASEQPLQADPAAIQVLVDVSQRLIRNREAPGNALELLRETAAGKLASQEDRVIRPDDVYEGLRRRTGLCRELAFPEIAITRTELEQRLAQTVIGQPGAVGAVADLVLRIKAEMEPPGRPMGSLLFIGPSGVGKTQMARSLADLIFGSDERLLRYDMSEYLGYDGLRKLIGGANDSGETGRLIADVQAQPFSVVLFDEVEKSDSTVIDLLLQVLGEGHISSGTGHKTSLRGCIVILTSNVGSDQYTDRPRVGLVPRPETRQAARGVEEALARHFRPEFLGRISQTVHFEPLGPDDIRAIAHRELALFGRRAGLARRDIHLDVSGEVIDLLVRQGTSAASGARALQRTLESHLTTPLSEWIAGNPTRFGAHLRLSVVDDAVVVTQLRME